MSAGGRVSQSMAVLNAPGIELLYSGVTSSRPSAEAMRSLSSAARAGIPCAASTSPSYSGMPRIDSMSMVDPAGHSSTAARSSAALNEPLRRLPAMPMILMGPPARLYWGVFQGRQYAEDREAVGRSARRREELVRNVSQPGEARRNHRPQGRHRLAARREIQRFQRRAVGTNALHGPGPPDRASLALDRLQERRRRFDAHPALHAQRQAGTH